MDRVRVALAAALLLTLGPAHAARVALRPSAPAARAQQHIHTPVRVLPVQLRFHALAGRAIVQAALGGQVSLINAIQPRRAGEAWMSEPVSEAEAAAQLERRLAVHAGGIVADSSLLSASSFEAAVNRVSAHQPGDLAGRILAGYEVGEDGAAAKRLAQTLAAKPGSTRAPWAHIYYAEEAIRKILKEQSGQWDRLAMELRRQGIMLAPQVEAVLGRSSVEQRPRSIPPDQR